jgi:two-component system response regulator YesN
MYSLLIADDEPLAQVGIKSMLDWGSIGVAIAGVASNGEQAFEAIERLGPDIVITDLRMPLLDGLELIERCKDTMPDCPVFIVLTAYADFESARRSLRSAAVDFLVKIELTEASLRQSVERAKAAVDAKRGARAPSPRRVPLGPADEASRTENVEGLGASSCASYLRVVFPRPERLSEAERDRAFRCALDMILELARREADARAEPDPPDGFALVLSFGAPESRPSERARAILENAREVAEKFFGLELSIGVGGPASGPGGMESSLEAAREAAARKAEARPEPGPQKGLAARRARVAACIARRDPRAYREEAERAVLGFSAEGTPKAAALEACCDFLYPVLERLDDGAAFLDSLFPGEADGYRCLFAAPSPARMRAWLETVGVGVADKLEALKARGNNPLVSGVRRYAIKNYAGKMALADVAAAFRVSPNYLSTVFKKYSGQGFAEYVSRIRVEKAKELLLSGKHRMFEVAQIVGFDDAFYFSKVFKKITGLSPREFCLRASDEAEPGDKERLR